MQKRLDEAVANNDKRLIRTIFTILVKRSWAVKVLAVWRITHINTGKNTAGVDNVKIPHASKEQQDKIRWRLLNEININSNPDAIKRIYIPKSNGKKKPLGIPTIKDRINQEILRIALDPICEYHFDDDSYGFRPKRSCQDAMAMIYVCLNKADRRKFIVEGDIKSCFDDIPHNHILRVLRNWEIPIFALRILRKILKSKIFDKEKFSENTEGTTQGGVISPMLANVALSTLDYYIRHETDYLMIRYADDFVILCKSKQQANEAKVKIATHLRNIGLTLSEEKTNITHIKKGFNFLGFTFRKYPRLGIKTPKNISDYTMLITPTKENVTNLLRKCKSIISKSKSLTQDTLIRKLNPILLNWGNYYKFVNSKVSYNKIDFAIWQKLHRWGSRRHNNKGGKWVVDKYFNFNDNLFLFGDTIPLIRLSSIPILNHIKVKKGVRVYCKNDSDYWVKRDKLNMYRKLMKHRSALFKKQNGKCAYCGSTILTTEISHVHHVLPKALGGTDNYSNLQLLHAECHRELHTNELRVHLV